MTTKCLPLATQANLRVSFSDEDFSRLTDEQLIQRLKTGKDEAMTHLFDRHYVIVRSIARKLLRNPEDVADLVQEAFLDVYQNARSFDPNKGALRGQTVACNVPQPIQLYLPVQQMQFNAHTMTNDVQSCLIERIVLFEFCVREYKMLGFAKPA